MFTMNKEIAKQYNLGVWARFTKIFKGKCHLTGLTYTEIYYFGSVKEMFDHKTLINRKRSLDYKLRLDTFGFGASTFN